MVPPESPCTSALTATSCTAKREVGSTFGEGALRTSELRNDVTHAPEVVAPEGRHPCSRRDRAERLAQRPGEAVDPRERRARRRAGAVGDEWVVPRGLVDHCGRQRFGVVRAEQPEVGIVEREVEQRFVPVALGQCRRAPAGPDRFADTTETDSRTSVLGDESLPRGDDASRVLPDRGHVGELHAVAAGAQRPLQVGDLVGVEHHEDRLIGVDGTLDKPEYPGHELVVARIEQRLVPVATHVDRTTRQLLIAVVFISPGS